jgi:hypothetical protein
MFTLTICLFLFSGQSISQKIYQRDGRTQHSQIQIPVEFKYIPKKPGHYTVEDWRAVIDTTWGEGLPTEQKLVIFDEAWNKIDAEFAAFQGLNIDWDSIKTTYRPEVAAGVSRGRFAAIMFYMLLSLQEFHTFVWDAPVMFTPLEPGIPLLVLGGNADNTSHFGATLTPLPDSTLLVIKAVENHPIGLIPGDIVLGYHGRLWKDLLKELLAYQLPVYFGYSVPAGDKISLNHNLLCGAGMNWHLFDTLDVVKYTTGDTMHYSTHLLAGQNKYIWGNEQLPVPGVEWVYDGSDNVVDYHGFKNYVSSGIIEGTNIGYIYAISWSENYILPNANISQKFYDAIYNFMFVQKTDGIIIDQRLNHGGRWQYQKGLSLLFDNSFKFYGFDERCAEPNNHYQMCTVSEWDSYITTNGDPNTFYDKPIAVLIGPAALSSGDLFPLTMKLHPMVRLFGKPTNGSLSTSPGLYKLSGDEDWDMTHTNSNCYLLDNPGNYLAHYAINPDEEVWFTQEDVAKGEDTVVKRAIGWINNIIETSIEDNTIEQKLDKYFLSQNYPNPFNPSTTIEFILPKSELTTLKVYNILGKEVATLVSNKLNQGNHTYQFDGKILASGIYYYQLVAGDYREVKKMVLLR